MRQPSGFRPQGGGSKPKQWPEETINQVRRSYRDGHTQKEIGAALGFSQTTVYRLMRWYGIKADQRRAYKRVPRGSAHPAWKGSHASPEAKRRRR